MFKKTHKIAIAKRVFIHAVKKPSPIERHEHLNNGFQPSFNNMNDIYSSMSAAYH